MGFNWGIHFTSEINGAISNPYTIHGTGIFNLRLVVFLTPDAPIPSASGLGMGFGYLNTT